ncbi:MAG: FAD-dependent oxidoreductase [Bacteroidetes bacterium]|nr:FAD-dependent oxidoreductase [Bacteroidota bacterium]
MKILIIGGVAGGASTAARLRRLDESADIILFEKGPHISYANCGLPYYIGGIIEKREKLFLQTPESFGTRFKLDVRVNSEVMSVDPAAKSVFVTNHKTGTTYTETYDKLVLSPGAEPVRPPLPGIDDKAIFTLRNVQDTDKIKDFATTKNVKTAVVVGAGFIGLEMAENLHHLGIKVSIVEMLDQVMAPIDFPMAAIVHRHIREKGVGLYLSEAVTHFERKDVHLTVNLKSGKVLPADLVILSIGVRPDNKLAKAAGLKIGETNGIWVNEFLQTSNADIYAVGDAIEFHNDILNRPVITYLAGPANKQARICANNIIGGNKDVYKGSVNTAIAKVFDLTAAVTGSNAVMLQRNNVPFQTSITHSGSHAGYYPGAVQMSMKINFAPDTGRLLGAQVVGADGVDKRIDLLAMVITNKGTIYDLMEIEHAYAPPFSSAKDPVNMAGFVADNILSGKMTTIQWNDIAALEPDSVFLVDVRLPSEHKSGHIPGSVNIPVDELRNRLSELPKDKKIVIYCQIGLRGYLAHRILRQSGFDNVVNLSGGFKTWDVVTA